MSLSWGKVEAAGGVFWLALQAAHHLTTAHGYKSHLANGHLGKAVPEKSGRGWVLGHDQASAGGGDYLGLLGCLSGSRLLTEEVALGQNAFIERTGQSHPTQGQRCGRPSQCDVCTVPTHRS